MQDLSAGPPHVTGHFDQLLLQRVCVLGQLVEALGPVCSSRVQFVLHRLFENKAKGSVSCSPDSCSSSAFSLPLLVKNKKKPFQTSKLRREPVKRATGATPLMTSISFGMFTAVWHYVANGCRAATMRGGVGG